MKDQSTPTINHFIALIKLKSMGGSAQFVEDLANNVISNLDLHVVNKIQHDFHPQGTTLAYILSESHLVIHTWPEFSTIHLDLVTCSSRTKDEFENSVKSFFPTEKLSKLAVKSVNFDK